MTRIPLPVSAPSAQGVDAAGIQAFVDAAGEVGIDLHSLAVARHGHLIAAGWWAPYAPDRLHLGYSLSKSFTATAMGLLVTDGRLSVEDRIVDLLPIDWSAAEPRWQQVQVKHALAMTIGHDVEAWDFGRGLTSPSGDILDAIAATTLDHERGTHFAYNQVCTYLLARIIREVTGQEVSAFLSEHLLGRLGLPDIPWHCDPAGHEIGFSGAHVPTASILALAQLYLDGGRWRGEQILDADWVADAVVNQGPPGADPDSDWGRGYGWSFWQSRHGFRGDGAFGQFAIVLPEHDMAIAITSEVEDMQQVLDLLWQHVLPAVDRTGDAEADAALADRLAGLTQQTPEPGVAPGAGPWTLNRGADSTLPATYAGARLSISPDGLLLEVDRGGQSLSIPVGLGEWALSVQDFGPGQLLLAAAGGWQFDGTLHTEILLLNTPHRLLVDADPAAGTIRLAWRRIPLMGPDPAALVVSPTISAD